MEPMKSTAKARISGLCRGLGACGLVLILGIAAGPALAALSADDVRAAKAAFQALDDKRIKRATRLAGRIDDKLPLKVISWYRFTGDGATASFEEISAFIRQNPDWPRQDRLRRNAEEAMPENLPADQVLTWFGGRKPESGAGLIRLGAALIEKGEKKKARAVVRYAWINGNFGKKQERRFYKRYRKLLTREDHLARLDRLLWEGRIWPVRRMLWKVDPDYRALGIARFLLRHRRGNVDKAIAKVPAALKNNLGLVYERLRWRVRKGRDMDARNMLVTLPQALPYPEKWWKERARIARKAISRGHMSEAYRVARGHGLKSGPAFAEAEWLAGWVALRFLKDHEKAMDHFLKMFVAVKYPVSRARGAYWVARAAEAMHEDAQAEAWYETAAKHRTTYYGQLALARLSNGHGPDLPAAPKPGSKEKAAFNSNELVRVIRVLSAIDEKERLKPFLLRLQELRPSPGWRVLAADLAGSHGRYDVAILISKKAARDGIKLVSAGYPALRLPGPPKGRQAFALERPLVLAMIRQESAFYPKAISPAGARGLLQLMPRTAKKIAKRARLPYSRRRLREDPRYNLVLGQSYLRGLLDTFKDSYVLSLAAYNAGPARARKWSKANGDPRDNAVDAVDWIELIPFEETRNYVQRVLENLQVYRTRTLGAQLAQNIEKDLKR